MIVNAIVRTHKGHPLSVETIVVFDDCIYCGLPRKREKPISVCLDGIISKVHSVTCPCDHIHIHQELDEDWMIIRELNDMNIVCAVSLKP